jgi:hypothetical protein
MEEILRLRCVPEPMDLNFRLPVPRVFPTLRL